MAMGVASMLPPLANASDEVTEEAIRKVLEASGELEVSSDGLGRVWSEEFRRRTRTALLLPNDPEEVTAKVRIAPDGSLLSVEAPDTPSGRALARSVERSAPFDPPPPSLYEGEFLDVQFNFVPEPN